MGVYSFSLNTLSHNSCTSHLSKSVGYWRTHHVDKKYKCAPVLAKVHLIICSGGSLCLPLLPAIEGLVTLDWVAVSAGGRPTVAVHPSLTCLTGRFLGGVGQHLV